MTDENQANVKKCRAGGNKEQNAFIQFCVYSHKPFEIVCAPTPNTEKWGVAASCFDLLEFFISLLSLDYNKGLEKSDKGCGCLLLSINVPVIKQKSADRGDY